MLFAERMGWPCNDGTLSSRPEPEPDILFSMEAGVVAFELAEICDRTLAHQSALDRKTGGVSMNWTTDPTAEIVNKKFANKYVTPHPIELLCYWKMMVVSSDDQVAAEINFAVQNNSSHQFRVVWYSGENAIYKWSIAEGSCSKIEFESERDPFWENCFT